MNERAPFLSASWMAAPATRTFRRSVTAMRGGLGEGLVILADQAFYSLASAVVGVLVARSCSKPVYGHYVLCVSIVMTLQLVQRSVISLPLTVKSASMDGESRATYLGSSLAQQLVFSAGVGVLMAATAAMLALGGRQLAPLVAALSVAAVSLLLRDFARSVLLARLKVWWSAGLSIVANTSTVIVACELYRLGRLSAAWGLGAAAAGALAPSLVFLALNRGEFRFVCSAVRPHLRLNWGYGKWTLGATAAASAGIRLVAWLVALLSSAAEVGVLGAIQTVAALIGPVTSGAAAFVTPKLARRAARDGIAAAARTSRLLIQIAFAFAATYVLAMAVFGDAVMRLLFHGAYDHRLTDLLLISGSAALDGVITPVRAMLRVRDRPELELYGNVAAAAVSLAVAFGTIPTLGATGAALSLFTGAGAQFTAFAFAERLAARMDGRVVRCVSAAPKERS